MVSRVLGDSRVEALVGEALEVAARTGFDAKRRLLGRAVADALLGVDEAAVDFAALIVMALAQLEPIHVRALIRLEAHTDRRKQNPEDSDSLAIQRTLTDPVAAALIHSGVGTPGMSAGPPMYVREITDFGRLLLDHLRSVADEEMERLADWQE